MKKSSPYLDWNRRFHASGRRAAYREACAKVAELRRMAADGSETGALLAKIGEIEELIEICLEHSKSAMFGFRSGLRRSFGEDPAHGVLREEELLQTLLEEKREAFALTRRHLLATVELERYADHLDQLRVSGGGALAKNLAAVRKMRKIAKKKFRDFLDSQAEREKLAETLFERIGTLQPHENP